MSRVFLAQEARLERTVVLKVLPPQMAAGVSVDRFEREIHLAANLQHPHIVPLLTAGSAGDLLYYIMPHIEGESLRARLAHDHELPVGESIRILRDVALGVLVAARRIRCDNLGVAGRSVIADRRRLRSRRSWVRIRSGAEVTYDGSKTRSVVIAIAL